MFFLLGTGGHSKDKRNPCLYAEISPRPGQFDENAPLEAFEAFEAFEALEVLHVASEPGDSVVAHESTARSDSWLRMMGACGTRRHHAKHTRGAHAESVSARPAAAPERGPAPLLQRSHACLLSTAQRAWRESAARPRFRDRTIDSAEVGVTVGDWSERVLESRPGGESEGAGQIPFANEYCYH